MVQLFAKTKVAWFIYLTKTKFGQKYTLKGSVI